MTVGYRPEVRSIGLVGPWRGGLESRRATVESLAHPSVAIIGYDLLLVTFDGEVPAEWAGTLSRALVSGTPVRHVGEYLEKEHRRVIASSFRPDAVRDLRRAGYRRRKPVLDKLLIVISAPATLLIGAGVAAAILVAMGRPILFRQIRVGRGGTVFEIKKFRTMSTDRVGGEVTLVDDERVTPLGRLLRRCHVDELPQLVNVLQGHMSLVGPRPEQPALVLRYILMTPAFAFRELVDPGITGWAQVRAGYAGDFAESEIKLEHDLFYMKHQSLLLDTIILVRTVGIMFLGRGAR